jgi:hypothetical protein
MLSLLKVIKMETNKNIAIVGSRNFLDVDVFVNVLNEIISIEGNPKTIVSGGAVGTDTLAYNWAKENNVDTLIFEPRYKDFPKKVRKWMAPKERNTTIVENSDVVIAFWDMKSTGTKDTIDKSVEKGNKVYIYNTVNNEITVL